MEPPMHKAPLACALQERSNRIDEPEGVRDGFKPRSLECRREFPRPGRVFGHDPWQVIRLPRFDQRWQSRSINGSEAKSDSLERNVARRAVLFFPGRAMQERTSKAVLRPHLVALDPVVAEMEALHLV